LCDAATLLQAPLITEDDETVLTLRALSDLHALFKPRSTRIAAKIVFYAAQVRRASAPFLRSLAADVERWATKLEKERERSGELREDVARETTHNPRDPLIVELF
jgi:hypothetical protein